MILVQKYVNLGWRYREYGFLFPKVVLHIYVQQSPLDHILTKHCLLQFFNCFSMPGVSVEHNSIVYVMTDNISCPTHFPKDKTEHKVDSLNIYCETLCQNKVYMKNCSLSPAYSIPQNQVICTT